MVNFSFQSVGNRVIPIVMGKELAHNEKHGIRAYSPTIGKILKFFCIAAQVQATDSQGNPQIKYVNKKSLKNWIVAETAHYHIHNKSLTNLPDLVAAVAEQLKNGKIESKHKTPKTPNEASKKNQEQPAIQDSDSKEEETTQDEQDNSLDLEKQKQQEAAEKQKQQDLEKQKKEAAEAEKKQQELEKQMQEAAEAEKKKQQELEKQKQQTADFELKKQQELEKQKQLAAEAEKKKQELEKQKQQELEQKQKLEAAEKQKHEELEKQLVVEKAELKVKLRKENIDANWNNEIKILEKHLDIAMTDELLTLLEEKLSGEKQKITSLETKLNSEKQKAKIKEIQQEINAIQKNMKPIQQQINELWNIFSISLVSDPKFKDFSKKLVVRFADYVDVSALNPKNQKKPDYFQKIDVDIALAVLKRNLTKFKDLTDQNALTLAANFKIFQKLGYEKCWKELTDTIIPAVPDIFRLLYNSDPQIVKHCPDLLKIAIKADGAYLRLEEAERYRSDRALVLDAIKSNPSAWARVHEKLKTDDTFMLEAIGQNPIVIVYMNPLKVHNYDFIIKAWEKNNLVLDYLEKQTMWTVLEGDDNQVGRLNYKFVELENAHKLLTKEKVLAEIEKRKPLQPKAPEVKIEG